VTVKIAGTDAAAVFHLQVGVVTVTASAPGYGSVTFTELVVSG